ncbi:MAG TPA: tRNA pseudouridine(13) synthase TruD, partial [Xanthomonadaceae bacterium]|nr:tRNA pseudouridine(13) synthase TruD [Xanthomonadaceae bacterium]
METPLLPRAHGEPVLRAVVRSTPEDFRVEELDGFAASGSGEHLLLTIEKRGMNTVFAAQRIARWAGVPEAAIGYAGLKDRHAVTTQRFSVHLPGRDPPPLEALEGEGLRVLDATRHARKLPRGALAGNRFGLLLREVEGEPAAIDARLRAIGARGVPNYFGEQRFGHGAGNVGKALAMFGGRRVRRDQRAILLSAARSELFNRV